MSNELSNINKIAELATLDHIAISEIINRDILKGNIEPIDIHLVLKKFEKINENVIGKNAPKETKEAILKSAEKYLEKGTSFEYKNAKISIASVYTWYDFTKCNDIYLNELKEIEKKIKELISNREESLKTITLPPGKLGIASRTEIIEYLPSLEWVDCGEEVILNAPIKYSKDGVKVTFKK